MTGLPEVRLSANAYTVGHWVLDLEEAASGVETTNKFDLDAPYQRASVWTLEQRQALVKSLYMGLPVGAVIVSVLPFRSGGASWRVVDGKQRVETVRMFIGGEFSVPAEWFRDDDLDRPCAEMVTFGELTGRGQRTFTMGRQLPALEFKGENEWHGTNDDGTQRWVRRTDDELLLAETELYLLVNGGGTPHSEDDLRRAAGLIASRSGTTG